jgi:voltage-gated potassium channel
MLIWLITKIRVLRRNRAILAVLSMLLFVLMFGSIAFYYFERAGDEVEDIWDAAYWVIVTITTVGFGDITPKTAGGRITFVLVAIGGIGTIAYVIEEIVSFSTRSQLKKMSGSGAVKMKKHTIIVGWNTKTEEAIKGLRNSSEEFLVVGSELNQAQLNAEGIAFITGDPTKSETLNRCNIKDAKTLMIPLENDSETIMVALAARKLNRGLTIVATCDMREHVEMMRGAGIDHIISHTELGGRLIARAVTEPVVVDFIMDASASAEGIVIRQMKVSEKTKLSDVLLKENENAIALYRDHRFFLEFTTDLMLDRGDYLVILSSSR